MATIAPALRAAGWLPTVAGRDWPDIPNWRVIDGFMSESEIDELIGSATVLLLPYKHYFQSAVAIRALEAGVPVVGRQTGFLTQILGPDFAGAVADWNDPGSWLAAIEQAANCRSSQLRFATEYAARGTGEWSALFPGDAL